METLHIIGGGMAGSEAAWQAAELGVPVVLHEMRPDVGTFAHRTGHFAEMVCSNSFRSDDDERNAVGLLHWEMRAAKGLVMEMASRHRLPAGGALAVDRDPFAEAVTERLMNHPLISVDYGEVRDLPHEGHWIIATGPLTSASLGTAIGEATGQDQLAFFDADLGQDAPAGMLHGFAVTADHNRARHGNAFVQGRQSGPQQKAHQPEQDHSPT